MASRISFREYCREVDRGRRPAPTKFAADFCHDFVRPPDVRSPGSLEALLDGMRRFSPCPEAVEGARSAWADYEATVLAG